jgi:hypothetical protein
MVGWFLLAGLVGYGACTVVAARCAYAVQRAALLSGKNGRPESAERFRADDREHAATVALLFGLFWPVTLPSYLAYRGAAFAVTAGPPRTDGERQAEAEPSVTRHRIQELEQELGLDATGPDGSGPAVDPAAP